MNPIRETIAQIMGAIKPDNPVFKARLKCDFFDMKEGELIEVKPLEHIKNKNAFSIISPFCSYPTRRMITAYHLDFIIDDYD